MTYHDCGWPGDSEITQEMVGKKANELFPALQVETPTSNIALIREVNQTIQVMNETIERLAIGRNWCMGKAVHDIGTQVVKLGEIVAILAKQVQVK